MALVMVLGVIVVLELMALHLVVISEVTALEAKVVADRTQLKYAAESGVDRAYWMLLQNLSEPSVESSETSLSESDLDDLSSWKTDARPHELEAMGFRVQVTLSDASAGLDVSGKNPRANLESLLITGEPDQEVESVQEFLDVLTDYVDARNGRSLHGKEQEDYEDDGVLAFPRDGPLQFREEMFWIDGLQESLPGVVLDRRFFQIVPPEGLEFTTSSSRSRRTSTSSSSGSKPSFLSSSLSLIQFLVDLDEAEMELVIEARQRWLADGISVEETLASVPDLLARIESKFEFETESSVVTIHAVASSLDGAISRELWVTRDTRPSAAFVDNRKKLFAYWEKAFF